MTQIKELLRIGLFVIIVLCGTSACSNDDSDDDELAKDYILKEVAWIMHIVLRRRSFSALFGEKPMNLQQWSFFRMQMHIRL